MNTASIALKHVAGSIRIILNRQPWFHDQIAMVIKKRFFRDIQKCGYTDHFFVRNVDMARIGAAFKASLALELVQMFAVGHFSLLDTRELTAFPSALPLVSSITSFMTLPISAFVERPLEAMTLLTMASRSWADIWAGK